MCVNKMNKCVRCKINERTKKEYNSIEGASICRYYYPESLCDDCIKVTLWKEL